LVSIINKNHRLTINFVDAHQFDESRNITPTKDLVEKRKVVEQLKQQILQYLHQSFETSSSSTKTTKTTKTTKATSCDRCTTPTTGLVVICNFKGGCTSSCHISCLAPVETADDWVCNKHECLNKCLLHLSSIFYCDKDWETISDVFRDRDDDGEDDDDDDDSDDDDDDDDDDDSEYIGEEEEEDELDNDDGKILESNEDELRWLLSDNEKQKQFISIDRKSNSNSDDSDSDFNSNCCSDSDSD
jgi:hypothetical protein